MVKTFLTLVRVDASFALTTSRRNVMMEKRANQGQAKTECILEVIFHSVHVACAFDKGEFFFFFQAQSRFIF